MLLRITVLPPVSDRALARPDWWRDRLSENVVFSMTAPGSPGLFDTVSSRPPPCGCPVELAKNVLLAMRRLVTVLIAAPPPVWSAQLSWTSVSLITTFTRGELRRMPPPNAARLPAMKLRVIVAVPAVK
ncbi:MAG: hypothetical protein NVV68_11330 [Dokdonella sp.]|nr:hypothetical protein [Dokdonella sp.]